MLPKLPARFCPLAERWALVKAGTEHKQKTVRPFHTISFRVTMQEIIDNESFEELGIAEHI